MSTANTIQDCGDAVCIIGGGPGGLSAARALKRQGISYEQFERHSDVGGIWDIHNPGSPMYESAHFISSRDLSGYTDFPMPKDYPDYPTNQQIVSYVRAFARAFGLYDQLRFGVSVKSIDKLPDARWRVSLENGELRYYRAVICATGCNWDPSLPEIKGRFNGEIRHSVSYKRGEEFKGKRVMVGRRRQFRRRYRLRCRHLRRCGIYQHAPRLLLHSQAPVRRARRRVCRERPATADVAGTAGVQRHTQADHGRPDPLRPAETRSQVV